MIRQTKRGFSKKMISLNNLFGWAAIFLSIWFEQSQWIAVSGFAYLAAINAYYMEIGHRDLAKILMNVGKSSSLDDLSLTSYNGPSMPEPLDQK